MAKQNKFTKSVLERLEQEAQKQKEIPAGSPIKEKPSTPAEKQEISNEKTNITVEAPKEEKKSNTKGTPDLSQFLTPKPEREAKNKTFYLDEEVINALHQAAQAQKMTDSRLVNELLRSVLGLA